MKQQVKDLRVSPLVEDDLRYLYGGVQWDILVKSDLKAYMKPAYEIFETTSMLKAHALPYLLSIPSERALAREISERELLQELCGFPVRDTRGRLRIPTRSTLAHFRIKYSQSDGFSEAMIRVLIALAVVARNRGILLSFITEILPREIQEMGDGHQVCLECSNALAVVSRATGKVGEDPKLAEEVWRQLDLPFVQAGIGHEVSHRTKRRVAAKRGIADELALPARVELNVDNLSLHFYICEPTWLYANTHLKDPLTSIGPTYRSRAYTACNILVTRQVSGRREVLLSQRLTGYGAGTYTLPGGKQQLNEAVRECALRELREETGIELIRCRPVSLRSTQFLNKPRVKSVGVLAEEYEGEPKNQEAMHNSSWEWFDLENLPTPLFTPTRMVIEDYLSGAFPELSWDDVDKDLRQAAFPLAIGAQS